MTSRRKDKGKRLSVLTDAEKFALYGLPDFDEGQQLGYLSLLHIAVQYFLRYHHILEDLLP